jgi:multidrug efflux system outer membrane protein
MKSGNTLPALPASASAVRRVFPPDVPPGLPSALIERRPDIREAEQVLVATNAEIGFAKAEFFPQIALTGGGGGALAAAAHSRA